MICDDCALAADSADGLLAVHTLTEAEHLRRGHARCRTRQLTAGQGRLNDGTAVAIQGHQCDCQHRGNAAGGRVPQVVPAAGAPPQSDEQAVVGVLEVRDA
jgi:hypothetical protein